MGWGLHLAEDSQRDEALGLQVHLIGVHREGGEDVWQAESRQVRLQDGVLECQGHHAQQRAQLHHGVLPEAAHCRHDALQAACPRHPPLVCLRAELSLDGHLSLDYIHHNVIMIFMGWHAPYQTKAGVTSEAAQSTPSSLLRDCWQGSALKVLLTLSRRHDQQF